MPLPADHTSPPEIAALSADALAAAIESAIAARDYARLYLLRHEASCRALADDGRPGAPCWWAVEGREGRSGTTEA